MSDQGRKTTALRFAAYGVILEVRTDAALAKLVGQSLPPGWAPTECDEIDRSFSITSDECSGASGATVHVLSADGAEVSRAATATQAIHALTREVRHYVAEFAPAHVFVHAGAVAWNGRGVVIPGASYTGKSTLVAELVRAGATYLSDEYAVFDPWGRLHPYAKPLSLRRSDGLQVDHSVESLGGSAGRESVELAVVISAPFAEPVAGWTASEVSCGQGVLLLLENAIAARRSAERCVSALGMAVQGAVTLCGPRGDAALAVPRIVERLEKACC